MAPSLAEVEARWGWKPIDGSGKDGRATGESGWGRDDDGDGGGDDWERL